METITCLLEGVQTLNTPSFEKNKGLLWVGHVDSGTSEMMKYNTASLK